MKRETEKRLVEQRCIGAYLDGLQAKVNALPALWFSERLQSASGEELRRRRTLKAGRGRGSNDVMKDMDSVIRAIPLRSQIAPFFSPGSKIPSHRTPKQVCDRGHDIMQVMESECHL